MDVSYLDFTLDSNENGWSWGQAQSPIAWPYDVAIFSVCLHLFIPFYKQAMVAFTLIGTDHLPVMSLGFNDKSITFVTSEGTIEIPQVIIPGFWSKFCLSADFESSLVKTWINGKATSNSFTNASINADGELTLIIGQYPLTGSPNYDSTLSWFGKITQLTIWSQMLPSEDFVDYSNCAFQYRRPLYKWDPSTIKLNYTAAFHGGSIEDVCRPSGVFSVLLSPPLVLPVAQSICSRLGGNLSVEGIPPSPIEFPDKIEEMDRNAKSIFKIKESWSSVRKFVYNYNERPKRNKLQKHIWRNRKTSWLARIKRDTTENLILEANNELSDENLEETETELSFSAVCTSFEPLILRAAGFCLDLAQIVEENFVLIGHKSESPFFLGYNGMGITFSRGKWVASSPLSPSIELWWEEALSEPTMSPIGRHLWLIMILVGKEVAAEDVTLPCDTEEIFLNLTPCPKENFTCSDGSCLPLEVRCDRKLSELDLIKADCLDASDEEFCYKLYVPEGKDPLVAPRPLSGEDISHVQMQLNLDGGEFVANKLVLSTTVRLTWKDPDFTVYNLQPDPLSNLVDLETKQEIWVPTILHGYSRSEKILVDNSSDISMLKENDGEIGDYEFSWEAYAYKGAETPLQTATKLSIEAVCMSNSFLFPFGLQRCTYPFTLSSGPSNFLQLSTSKPYGGIAVKKLQNTINYAIKNVYFRPKSGSIHSTQELVIEFYSRIWLALMSLFLPTIALVFVAYSSFYIPFSETNLRMLLSVVPLILMVIVQTHAGTALTDNTSLKASDIWIFGCFFAILFVLTINVYFVSEMSRKQSFSTKQVAPISSSASKPKHGKTTSRSNLNEHLKIYFPVVIGFLVIFYMTVFIILCQTYGHIDNYE